MHADKGVLTGFFFSFLLFFFTSWIWAADPPSLSTDRPGATDGTSILPPGYVQLETGVGYLRDESGNTTFRQWQVPGTLVRVGWLENMEFRVFWAGYLSEETQGPGFKTDRDGLGDAGVGLRRALREESGGIPAMAVLANVSLPTGEDGFSSDRADPSVKLAFANTLTPTLSLGYNLGMAWSTGTDATGERHTLSTANYSLSLGIGISDRTGAFVEVFGDVPASAPGGPSHAVDGGISWLLSGRLQLDVSGGTALSSQGTDLFLNAGFSYRWPR